jgi:hypothetical protein
MRFSLGVLAAVVAQVSSAQSPAATASAEEAARRKACPLAQAPDSVVGIQWDSLTAPANVMTDAPHLSNKWVRNVMLVTFNREVTLADQRAVLALIQGDVVGVSGWPINGCQYIVRIPYALPGDSLSGPVLRAFVALRDHPAVQAAYPIGMFNPNVLH